MAIILHYPLHIHPLLSLNKHYLLVIAKSHHCTIIVQQPFQKQPSFNLETGRKRHMHGRAMVKATPSTRSIKLSNRNKQPLKRGRQPKKVGYLAQQKNNREAAAIAKVAAAASTRASLRSARAIPEDIDHAASSPQLLNNNCADSGSRPASIRRSTRSSMKSPPEYLPGATPAQRQAADLERSRVCTEEESIDLSPNDRPGTRSINPPSSRKRSTPSLFIAEPSAHTKKGPTPFSKIRRNLEQSNQLNSTLSKSMKYYKKEYNKCMTEIHRLNKLVIDNKTPDPMQRGV